MKITKTVTIQKPAEDVWHLIAHEFDKAHLWMDPIPNSYAIEGESTIGAPMEGRICHLSKNPNGARAKEVLTQYDEKNKSLTFEITSINVPAIVPIKKNTVQMFVKKINDQKTQVTWVASPELKTLAYPFYPLLRIVASAAFGKLLKGLKTYAESTPLNAAKAA